jgi:cytochrome c553
MMDGSQFGALARGRQQGGNALFRVGGRSEITKLGRQDMKFAPEPQARMRGFVFFVLALSAFSAGAQALDERMKKVLADPVARDSAIAAAKSVTSFCANCHGGDGNSTISEVPNLAAQHPVYLLVQIEKYVKGQRHNRFMESLMKVLRENDRINATVYYSSQVVRPAGVASSVAGQSLYRQRCVICHDARGYGTETTPRLAGQQIDYLIQSMTRYRDQTGERIYAPMVGSTAGLKDQDIKALAVYMSSMY